MSAEVLNLDELGVKAATLRKDLIRVDQSIPDSHLRTIAYDLACDIERMIRAYKTMQEMREAERIAREGEKP